MSNDNNQIVKQQFMSLVPQGSVLSKILADIPPEEVARLKSQAVDEMLRIEIQRIVAQHKLQISATEMDMVLQAIRGLQREHESPGSSYSYQSRIQTASGETTITSKKGCYIATAVYGSSDHPTVLILRRFRDRHLETNSIGRSFCAVYYRVSPLLANGVFARGIARDFARSVLDRVSRLLV